MPKYVEKSAHDQRESHLKFGLKSGKIANSLDSINRKLGGTTVNSNNVLHFITKMPPSVMSSSKISLIISLMSSKSSLDQARTIFCGSL